MYYEDEGGVGSFFAGLLLGAAIGAGVALMLAPQSGKRTRKRLRRVVGDARETAGDRWEDLASEMRSAVDASRQRLQL
jgi:gas vesicle protein